MKKGWYFCCRNILTDVKVYRHKLLQNSVVANCDFGGIQYIYESQCGS